MKRENGKHTGSLIIMCLLIAFCILGSTMQDRARAEEIHTAIQAHSGASFLAPENTLAAFRKARETGADGLETDIRMTADGYLVLCHDETINRTSSGSGRISEMTLAELKQYDFGSWFDAEYAGERILTLEEALDAVRKLDFSVFNVELKPTIADADQIVRLTADAIRSSGIEDRIMVSSFDAALLKSMKQYAPEIQVALLSIPNLSVVLLFRLSDCLPLDKPISEYTAKDVQKVPQTVVSILRGFGAKGESAEELLLEVVQGVAAVVPEGTTWPEAEIMIKEQAELVSYVDGLDFQIDYLNCQYNSLTNELLAAMHERGIGVNVWTADSEIILKRILQMQPEGVITNEPGLAAALREELKQSDNPD